MHCKTKKVKNLYTIITQQINCVTKIAVVPLTGWNNYCEANYYNEILDPSLATCFCRETPPSD